MNQTLNFHALSAWAAFGVQDYSGLEQHSKEIYNYFVHNPEELLNIDNPLLIGKIFHVCLGFREPDEDIQEVRAENAFLCFSRALNSDKGCVHDEASARLMMLLINEQRHLIGYVEHACQKEYEYINPYTCFMLDDGMPNDMPMATNTMMLFTAYYLYNGIIAKDNVSEEFVNAYERNIFAAVEKHVLHHCNQLSNTPANRKIELGKIVFDKICKKLHKDIEDYSNSL